MRGTKGALAPKLTTTLEILGLKTAAAAAAAVEVAVEAGEQEEEVVVVIRVPREIRTRRTRVLGPSLLVAVAAGPAEAAAMVDLVPPTQGTAAVVEVEVEVEVDAVVATPSHRAGVAVEVAAVEVAAAVAAARTKMRQSLSLRAMVTVMVRPTNPFEKIRLTHNQSQSGCK